MRRTYALGPKTINLGLAEKVYLEVASAGTISSTKKIKAEVVIYIYISHQLRLQLLRRESVE